LVLGGVGVVVVAAEDAVVAVPPGHEVEGIDAGFEG
jgi:hypothetical protein